MTIEAIHSSDRDGFVAALGGIFEHSPWVAERTWAHRPFATIKDLHQAMIHEVEAAHATEKLALIRAHPDLGAKANISTLSAAEQAGAGLDQLTPAEYERLQILNAAYRDRFGFPFILAVKGGTKQDILQALEQRLQADREDELRTALEQIYRIALFRLT